MGHYVTGATGPAANGGLGPDRSAACRPDEFLWNLISSDKLTINECHQCCMVRRFFFCRLVQDLSMHWGTERRRDRAKEGEGGGVRDRQRKRGESRKRGLKDRGAKRQAHTFLRSHPWSIPPSFGPLKIKLPHVYRPTPFNHSPPETDKNCVDHFGR